MGKIVGVYGLGWLAVLAYSLIFRRPALIPGWRIFSANLLLASALLGEAALAGGDGVRSRAPLAAGLLILASLAIRNFSLLLGGDGRRALELLERCCAERGIPLDRDGGRLVLKRQGAAIRTIGIASVVALFHRVRRRKEPELDRLDEVWRSAVSREGRWPR